MENYKFKFNEHSVYDGYNQGQEKWEGIEDLKESSLGLLYKRLHQSVSGIVDNIEEGLGELSYEGSKDVKIYNTLRKEMDMIFKKYAKTLSHFYFER